MRGSTRRAPTSSSTPTTPWTGTCGAPRRSREHSAKTSRSCCPWGACHWLYAEAALSFDTIAARTIVEQTIDYLVADMRDAGGAFYSATDADSEGVEGTYFCWTPAQLREQLGEDLAERFAQTYGVREGGNFERGLSALHLAEPLTRERFDALAATAIVCRAQTCSLPQTSASALITQLAQM